MPGGLPGGGGSGPLGYASHLVLSYKNTYWRQTLYECDVCKRKFSQSGHLASHKRTHTREKPCECDGPKLLRARKQWRSRIRKLNETLYLEIEARVNFYKSLVRSEEVTHPPIHIMD